MITVGEALEVQADAALHKVEGLHSPARFAVSGMLAGAYIGMGVLLMVSTAGPLAAAGDGLAKLVSGLVFGVALTLVVFAGGELVTSSMMTLTQGTAMRAVQPGRAAVALGFTFVANFVGAAVFSILVSLSGVLHSNPAAAQMLQDMLAAKSHEGPGEMFVRGLLCNVLVCLAIWMCARLKSDGVKIAVIFAAILAFISSGFEHVVANMTTFIVGMTSGYADATWAAFGSNMLWVGLGNLVGGALVVGLGYWFVGGSPRIAAVVAVAEAAEFSPADIDTRTLPALSR